MRHSCETPTGYPSSVGSPSASPCVSGSFFLSQLFGNASRTLTMSNPSWPGGSAPRPPRLYAEDGGSRPTPCACSPWLAEPLRGCGDACFGASAPGRWRGVARIYLRRFLRKPHRRHRTRSKKEKPEHQQSQHYSAMAVCAEHGPLRGPVCSARARPSLQNYAEQSQ